MQNLALIGQGVSKKTLRNSAYIRVHGPGADTPSPRVKVFYITNALSV